MVKLKRAYDPPSPRDGYRVLVERLWPRGMRKQDLVLDMWARELAPSNELRKWYSHDPARWQEFQRRYRRELKEHTELLGALALLAAGRTVTLIFSAHDPQNSAVVLREELEQLAPERHPSPQ